jgi:excisionase family DNA binding protein
MRSFNPQVDFPEVVLEKHISVEAAAEFSGYSIRYLRRLLRTGRLEGVKTGKVWLITLASLDAYLKRATCMDDGRCGPRAALRNGTNNASEVLSGDAGIPARTRCRKPPVCC